MSNIKMFKYELVWDKKIPSGMSYARFQPMRQHENILVFCNGKTIYNPQMIKRDKPIKGGGMSKGETTNNQNLLALKKTYDYKNPTTIIVEDKIRKDSLHPTQKPVALFEYLIKTYTNEGDIVLDNCAGSGTTGVACKNLNRNYILIEKELEYVNIIKERLKDERSNMQEPNPGICVFCGSKTDGHKSFCDNCTNMSAMFDQLLIDNPKQITAWLLQKVDWAFKRMLFEKEIRPATSFLNKLYNTLDKYDKELNK